MDKKTKAQYTLAWMIPALVFTVAMLLLWKPLKEIDAAYRFADDDSYIGLAAAHSYKAARMYGLSIYEAMPATRDSLWHAVQIAVSGISDKAPQVLLLLNFLFALLAIRVTSVLARRWCPGPFSTFAATLLFALLPMTMLAGMQGRPLALMLFLGAAACASHLKGIDGDGVPLSFRTAMLVGLAAMVHVESLVLWIIFGLHALCVMPFTRRKGAMATTAYQFIMGLFVLGIMLWPLVHWNVVTLHVPWPISMDASLSVEAVAQGQVDSTVNLNSSISSGSQSLIQRGLGYMIPLVIIGGLGLIAAAVKQARLRFLLPVFLFPVLLMIGVSAMAVVTGQGGVQQVPLLLVPLMIALSIAGLAYVPGMLPEGLPLPAPLTVRGISQSLGALGLVVMMLLLTGAGMRQRDALVEQLTALQVERASWEEQLSNYPNLACIATDRPGWAAYRFEPHVLDLTGRCTWQLLSCLDARGGINGEMFARFLGEAKPGVFVVWNEEGRELAREMQAALPGKSEEVTVSDTSAAWFNLRW